MNKNIKIKGTGLVCDNPKCDWEDRTIADEETFLWVNKSCPKCGENLLTEEDFERWQTVIMRVI